MALGRRLKARRNMDDMDIMNSYVPPEKQDEADPAESNEELQNTLQESMKKGEEKMTQVATQHCCILTN